MAWSLTEEEVISWLKKLHEDESSEIHDELEAAPLAGGFLFSFRSESNPFSYEGKETHLIPTRDCKKKRLEYGVTEQDGKHIAFFDFVGGFDEFIDVGDDHDSEVWIGPKEGLQEGAAYIRGEYEKYITGEIVEDITEFTEALKKVDLTNPNNQHIANIKTAIGELMRKLI